MVPSAPTKNELGSGASGDGWKASSGSVRSTPGQPGCSESGDSVPQKTEYRPPGIRPFRPIRASVRGPSGPPTVWAVDVAVAPDHSPHVTASPGLLSMRVPVFVKSGSLTSVVAVGFRSVLPTISNTSRLKIWRASAVSGGAAMAVAPNGPIATTRAIMPERRIFFMPVRVQAGDWVALATGTAKARHQMSTVCGPWRSTPAGMA